MKGILSFLAAISMSISSIFGHPVGVSTPTSPSNKPLTISEVRAKLTPEIQQCIIDKLGKAEARKLLEEVQQTKTVSPQTMGLIKPCLPSSLGGGPAGPLPPATAPPYSSTLSGSSGNLNQPAKQKLDASGLVVYQTWFNYYAQNSSNGQNSPIVFVNAADHLKDLADMGITMIQMSPFHPYYNGVTSETTIGAPSNILDFYDVNPGYAGFPNPKTNLGTKDVRIQALKDYVNQAHGLGMKVIADCIYHTTSPYSPLIKEHPDYYRHDARGNLIYLPHGKDVYNQVELDFTNPAVVSYMIDMTKYWVNTAGIDGCRSDVAAAENLPFAFWVKLNNELKKIKPDWFQVAEITGEINKYGGTYSNKDCNKNQTCDLIGLYGFDALYGVSHMSALRKSINGRGSTKDLKSVWTYPDANNQAAAPIPGTVFYRTEDNADQNLRAEVLAGGNSGMIVGMVVNFTLDGIPFIYNGQEIGDGAKTSINKQLYINWTNPPHLENRTIFTQILNIRKSHTALKKGTTVWYSTSSPDNVISYLRQEGNDKVLVVINLSSNPWNNGAVTGDNQLNGVLTPLYNSNNQDKKVSQPKNNQIILSLEPWGFLIASLR